MPAPDSIEAQDPYDPPAVVSESAEDAARSTMSSATFSGFLSTQFLGAFNDNYYKQIVLLMCVTLTGAGMSDRQPYALAAFALPFVLLSGFAGYLSDRYSKTRIIVLSKFAEIVVMLMSLVVLSMPGISESTQLWLLIIVLALMGAQSAFFSPSKYGALPELFRSDVLLPVNGAIQTTTFLAILLGTAAAGFAESFLRGTLWLGSVIAVGIAVVGTVTSLMIRPLPAAKPDLQFDWDALLIPRQTRALLRANRELLTAIAATTVFWFIGAVTQPAVNYMGKNVLELSSARTSLMLTSVAIGLAIGCTAAGLVPQRRGNQCIRVGAWGIIVILLVIAALSSGRFGKPVAANVEMESFFASVFQVDLLEALLRISMTLLGFWSGVFVVPVQVFLQHAPPPGEKGRLLAALNLTTWIGIVISAGYLQVANLTLTAAFGALDSHYFLMFVALAVLMLPIAVFFRLSVCDPEMPAS